MVASGRFVKNPGTFYRRDFSPYFQGWYIPGFVYARAGLFQRYSGKVYRLQEYAKRKR
jgi:hypothetical protein